jgi:hypothetical protein
VAPRLNCLSQGRGHGMRVLCCETCGLVALRLASIMEPLLRRSST